jgi:hypothetical protein
VFLATYFLRFIAVFGLGDSPGPVVIACLIHGLVLGFWIGYLNKFIKNGTTLEENNMLPNPHIPKVEPPLSH